MPNVGTPQKNKKCKNFNPKKIIQNILKRKKNLQKTLSLTFSLMVSLLFKLYNQLILTFKKNNKKSFLNVLNAYQETLFVSCNNKKYIKIYIG